MTKVSLVVLGLVALGFFSSPAFAWQERGNGGGGVVRDGVYMTFGTAGIYVDPEPMDMAVVPSLGLTMDTIKGLGLPETYKSELLSLLIPFGARKYFNVIKERFDEDTYAKLREQYANLVKVPADSIAIFAVTDPRTRHTYLLPEFFGLQPAEQAAILFHEAYWIKRPRATYREVVAAEVAFQKYVQARERGEFSPVLASRLADFFEDYSLALNMYLQQDLASGALTEALGASRKEGAAAWLLLDEKVLCDDHVSYHRGSYRGEVSPSAGQLERTYAIWQRYPQSYFLKGLLDYLSPDADGKSRGIHVGLNAFQVKYLEAHYPTGKCWDGLNTISLRFTGVKDVDGNLYLQQAWE